jgi:hypothetical protein
VTRIANRAIAQAFSQWTAATALNKRQLLLFRRVVLRSANRLVLRVVMTTWAKRALCFSHRCERARRLMQEQRVTSASDEKERFLCAGLDSIRKLTLLGLDPAQSRPTPSGGVGSTTPPASGFEVLTVLSEIHEMEKRLGCVHAAVTNASQLPAQALDEWVKSCKDSDGGDDVLLTQEMLLAKLQAKLRRTSFEGVQFIDLYGEFHDCSTVRVQFSGHVYGGSTLILQVWEDVLVVLKMLSERMCLLKSIFRFYALHSQLQKDKRTFGIDTTQWQVRRKIRWPIFSHTG